MLCRHGVRWLCGVRRGVASSDRLSIHYTAACCTRRCLRECDRHDLLQNILGVPLFLDSQNLRDLKELFVHGLGSSEVLVLLATTNVLSRPYCLLELWCAARFGVPVDDMLFLNKHKWPKLTAASNMRKARTPT